MTAGEVREGKRCRSSTARLLFFFFSRPHLNPQLITSTGIPGSLPLYMSLSLSAGLTLFRRWEEPLHEWLGAVQNLKINKKRKTFFSASDFSSSASWSVSASPSALLAIDTGKSGLLVVSCTCVFCFLFFVFLRWISPIKGFLADQIRPGASSQKRSKTEDSKKTSVLKTASQAGIH